MANDLSFAMGGDISAFERAMATAVTTGAQSFAKIEAACRASSARIDSSFGTSFSKVLGGVGNVERALGALKIAGAVFIGFELLKSVLDSIEESAGEAAKEMGRLSDIGSKARAAGVGTDFFQAFSDSVKKLGLDASQAEEILKNARGALDVRLGEEGQASSSSALDRVGANEKAGNLSAGSTEQLRNADSLEEKERVILDLLDQMQAKGANLAAFDLGGKVFGPDFETRLRNGENIIGNMRGAMEGLASAEAARIIPAEQIADAEREAAEQAEQNRRVQALLKDYYDLMREYNQGNLDIVQDLKSVFISTAEEVKKIVGYLEQGSAALKSWDLNMSSIANKLGAGYLHDHVFQPLGLTFDKPVPSDPTAGAGIGGEAARDSKLYPGLYGKVPDTRSDASHALPSTATPRAPHEAAEQADEVDNLIKSLNKAAAAEQGEAAAVGLGNAAKQRAIDLAKAEEAAKERGSALTAEERRQVLASADAYSAAKAKLDDFQHSQQRAAEQAQFFGDTLEGAFEGIIVRGQGLQAVFKNLVQTLESSAIKALLTGQGPLAGLFGTATKAGATGSATVGGLLGSLLHFADGGMIAGPGGPRSDQVPVLASHGEYIVNARAAAANLPVLDAINSNRLPRFADGGLVTRVSQPLSNRPASMSSQTTTHAPVYNIDARGAQSGVADQIVDAIQKHDAEINRTFGQRYVSWRQGTLGGR